MINTLGEKCNILLLVYLISSFSVTCAYEKSRHVININQSVNYRVLCIAKKGLKYNFLYLSLLRSQVGVNTLQNSVITISVSFLQKCSCIFFSFHKPTLFTVFGEKNNFSMRAYRVVPTHFEVMSVLIWRRRQANVYCALCVGQLSRTCVLLC